MNHLRLLPKNDPEVQFISACFYTFASPAPAFYHFISSSFQSDFELRFQPPPSSCLIIRFVFTTRLFLLRAEVP